MNKKYEEFAKHTLAADLLRGFLGRTRVVGDEGDIAVVNSILTHGPKPQVICLDDTIVKGNFFSKEGSIPVKAINRELQARPPFQTTLIESDCGDERFRVVTLAFACDHKKEENNTTFESLWDKKIHEWSAKNYPGGNTRWTVMVYNIQHAKTLNAVCILPAQSYEVDNDGFLVAHPDYGSGLKLGLWGDSMAMNMPMEEVNAFVDVSIYLSIGAFAMCGFKNVKLTEIPVSPNAEKSMAKSRKNNKTVSGPVSYSVIEIGIRPPKDAFTGRRPAKAELNYERFCPEHIVRGHTKTYSEEAPLFGKITGTFWWSPSVRGDREVGQKEHLYTGTISA
jgi:hypothetical protein